MKKDGMHKRERPKILVGCEGPANAASVARVLADKGFTVKSARAGAAVELARSFAPDIILLDMATQEPAGYETVRRLKEDGKTRAIPVLLVTAGDGAEDKMKALDAGADDYIARPVNTAELLMRVRSLVKLKRLQDQVNEHGEYALSLPLASGGPPSEEKGRVLIVEDDARTATLFSRLLGSHGYETLTARDGLEAMGVIEKEKPDLVLLDLMLPDMDGFAVLKRIRASALMEDLPIVVVSVVAQPDVKVKAINSGADDYIVKPPDNREMLARINALLRKKEVRCRLRAGIDTLFRQTIIDPLTGLYNRRYLRTVVENHIAVAARYNRPFILLMIDIDRFKEVNDFHGHLAGDGVLQELGNILTDRLRACDLAARYGGEEFVVVLTDNTLDGARTFAERLRATVEAHGFPTADGGPITVSIGIAQFQPGDACMEAVVKRADDALYRAKQEGRNLVR